MNKNQAVAYMQEEILKLERKHMADSLKVKSSKISKEIVTEILSKIDKLEIEDEN